MTVATSAIFTGATSGPYTGNWTPDGSPVSVTSGDYKAFPGVARLPDERLVLVYRDASNHSGTAPDGSIVGRISTDDGATWGAQFDILTDGTNDVRCDDAVSIVDDKVVVTGRYHDGADNIDPFILHAPLSGFSASATWTKVAISALDGLFDTQRKVDSRVHKVGSSYIVGCMGEDAGAKDVGVLISSSLTDWSAPTFVSVAETGYSEIGLVPLGGSDILALLRYDTTAAIRKATSSDGGATWSAPATGFAGHGQPMARLLTDNTILSIYRDAPNGDTAWRTSDDGGATWGDQTILDAAGARNTYASVCQYRPNKALCVYGIDSASDGSGTSSIYSQVFTKAV